MRLFGPLYERCLGWARHRHAPRYLAAMSAAESVVFPIPPDVMLAPMALARPEAWWRYALLCTLASVAGGLLGYVLGSYALDLIWPWMQRMGWEPAFLKVQEMFQRYGFVFVFLAAFTPIPFKVFTIASGALGVGLLPFLLGSLIGRGTRFFLVAGLIAWGGERLEAMLRRYVEALGWFAVALVGLVLIWMEWIR